MQGKSYDLAQAPDLAYFEPLMARLLGHEVDIDMNEPWHLPGPVYGDPRLTPQRLGQQAFQATVLHAYHRRCAITGAKIRPILQAAHIRPLPSGGEHRLDNGLLLRSDVHTLYDRGYLGVDPITAFSSARGCATSSAMASSSTPRQENRSPSPNEGQTDPAENSSNGTSTRSTRRRR